jgi:Flp pilus assembly pilin Flp
MKQLASRQWREEAGQDLNECAPLMALIALSSVTGMHRLAQAISNVYGNAATNLSTPT